MSNQALRRRDMFSTQRLTLMDRKYFSIDEKNMIHCLYVLLFELFGCCLNSNRSERKIIKLFKKKTLFRKRKKRQNVKSYLEVIDWVFLLVNYFSIIQKAYEITSYYIIIFLWDIQNKIFPQLFFVILTIKIYIPFV